MLICFTPFVATRSTEEGHKCRAPVEGRSYGRIRRFRTLCWPSVSGRYVTMDVRVGYLYEVEVYSAQRGIIFAIQQDCSFTDLPFFSLLPFLIIM